VTRKGRRVHSGDKKRGQPPHAIVVMGVSGCGKSTLVADLAAQLHCPAFEGDDYHSPTSVAKMRAGHPLDDADRWPWLDRLGAAIGAAATDNGVAVAACSALKRSYRERLEVAAGVPLLFVLLDGTREEIAARLAARKDHYMPASLLDSQLATLERPGTDERALVLPCSLPVAELREGVLTWAATFATTNAR
jgi:gluconokinase